MLQYLRAGDAAFLVDVAHDKGCESAGFCLPHHRHGTFPHLADASGGRGNVAVKHGLYRVDDHNRRLEPVNCRGDFRQLSLCQHIDFPLGYAQALGAHLQLAAAFLAGHIQNSFTGAHQAAELEKKRGLPHPGRAAHKNDGTAHGSSAKHAVKLADAREKPDLLLRIQLRDQFRRIAAQRFCSALARAGRGRSGGGRFGYGVPRAAGQAFPGPFSGFISAFRAEKQGFLFHQIIPSDCAAYWQVAASSTADILIW